MILFLTTNDFKASHIVGGDMYYDYLGNDVYRITVILYRDCASSGAQYDDPMPVDIYDRFNNNFAHLDIPKPPSQTLPIIFSNPCVTPPTGICTERAIYTQTVTLAPRVGGYTISYQRCCRGPNVTNLIAPEDNGLTLTVHIPGSDENSPVNSSPRYNNYPPLVICNNDDLVFDHSALDPDGDSLVYELVTPYAGADDISPAPNPIPPPPYAQVNWGPGYSSANPLGPGATIAIDPNTGVLTADPDLVGLFVVGIRVKEYRNGVLIGQSDRDFLFKVINCNITLKAEITPQIESSTFISFCQGYTTVFENEGYGATFYEWDFGVPNVTTDVSTDFEPTFTFPGPGTYNVRLVANPGWSCTDTAYQVFEIYDELSVLYQVQDSICVTNNSLDFVGSYQGPSNPSFSWDFGDNATPTGGNTLDVTGVHFLSGGVYPVTLYATAGTCSDSFTTNVVIFDLPQIAFNLEPALGCIPYTAVFQDASTSIAQLNYLWDFGDGGISTEANPTHVYDQPGSYDVSLSITSVEGCVSTQTVSKPGLIHAIAPPEANFTSNWTSTDVFTPYFDLYDHSIDSYIHYYMINDTLLEEDRNPRLSFEQSGKHKVTQYVINQEGCRDTMTMYLEIEPFTTYYIPNTFTPDGNLFNNEFQPVVYDAMDYELYIYDRWGELLFHTTESRAAWDGTFKGKPCPDGTYNYQLKLRKKQDTRELLVINGHVTLLR